MSTVKIKKEHTQKAELNKKRKKKAWIVQYADLYEKICLILFAGRYN